MRRHDLEVCRVVCVEMCGCGLGGNRRQSKFILRELPATLRCLSGRGVLNSAEFSICWNIAELPRS